MEKYYNLLRPFDLEAAKRGEPVVVIDIRGKLEPREYIAGPDASGFICIKYPDGEFDVCDPNQYKMAPLCWVEGKPVYKGDVLYDTDGTKIVAEDCSHNGAMIVCCGSKWGVDLLTWTKLKVKREAWVNVYAYGHPCWRYPTKEEADNSARLGSGLINPDRIACVRIEWEEPAA